VCFYFKNCEDGFFFLVFCCLGLGGFLVKWGSAAGSPKYHQRHEKKKERNEKEVHRPKKVERPEKQSCSHPPRKSISGAAKQRSHHARRKHKTLRSRENQDHYETMIEPKETSYVVSGTGRRDGDE